MQINELSVPGAFEVVPTVHGDDRGAFYEWYRADLLGEVTGGRFAEHSPLIAQANCSLSQAGTLRGIHVSQVPPGQAKYVTCFAGAVLDVVVDLRVGSETFGRWDTVLLDAASPRCVYLAEGLGHGFLALADHSVVTYLCSTGYDPAREHTIDPFDPTLGIAWPTEDLAGEPLTYVLSPRDRDAQSLAEARERGLLG